MARCKDAPLTEQELADWRGLKQAHDKNELIDTDVARFRTAAEQVPTILREAANAVKYDLMEPLTETAIAELWEALDEYIRQIEKKATSDQRDRRPKAKQITYVEDEDRWLPEFFPPDSPEYSVWRIVASRENQET